MFILEFALFFFNCSTRKKHYIILHLILLNRNQKERGRDKEGQEKGARIQAIAI